MAHSILENPHLLADGGMGTMLQEAGLPAGYPPDAWNIERADAVRRVHDAYVAAGAQMLTTNTFGSNALRLKHAGHSAAETAAAGVRIARGAADAAGRPCYVALDVGPLGVFLEPYDDMTEEEATELFGESIRAGAGMGADCILVETMGAVNEARAAVTAGKRYGEGLPVFCTLSFSAQGRLMTGEDVETVVAALTEAGADGIGCNCGVGPDALIELMPRFTACAKLPLLMSPNAGLPVYRDGRTCYDVTPEAFAEDMARLKALGAWSIGGCCGTTPAHIRAMRERCFAE